MKTTRVQRNGLRLVIAMSLVMMGSTAWANPLGDCIFLLEGSYLNGQPITSLDNVICVAPGESITGILKIRVQNGHGPAAVVPVIWTPTWGDHASSWVSVTGWAPTGTSFYDVPISLAAPDFGTYYIIFGSQGQTHGSYIASLTGWFLGFNSWDDGMDLADMDEVDLGDCMTTGYAMLPVMDSPGVYSDCQTGCTYVKVVVTPPAIEADVDIDPDVLNLDSKGKWITCYIALPEGYDVSDVDPATILLDQQIPAAWGAADEATGILMVKFDHAAVQQLLQPGEAELLVTGALADGTLFAGTDTILVIDP